MKRIKFCELVEREGEKIAVSEWTEIPQDLIDIFAEVTGDRNLVHLNNKSARVAGFDRTIAHGYLLISLIPKILEQHISLPTSGTIINRDIKWTFRNPVLSNDSIRLRVVVQNARVRRGITIVTLGINMEVLSTGKIAGEGFATYIYTTKKTKQ
ncbi:hypothetical protein IH779_03715 [Patescibacteria group bacterium]|nr:hypothetical protein [Patescibacteria group bacterium]